MGAHIRRQTRQTRHTTPNQHHRAYTATMALLCTQTLAYAKRGDAIPSHTPICIHTHRAADAMLGRKEVWREKIIIGKTGTQGFTPHAETKCGMDKFNFFGFPHIQWISSHHQMTLSAAEERGVLGATCMPGVMERIGGGEADPGGAGARRGLPKAEPWPAPRAPSPATPSRDAAAFSFKMAILKEESKLRTI